MKKKIPIMNSTICSGCGADTHTGHGVDGRSVSQARGAATFWLCMACLGDARRGEIIIKGYEWLRRERSTA